MLYSLTVSNYILIGSLETRFPEGLVIISGETGAGKSILLGALSLVLGAKADAGMVGPHGENCVVEAEFGMDENIRRILSEADLPADGDRLLLRRSVAKSGRSRSFANDEPVSLPVLQALSAQLVDIHSQHQTLRLADERFRMEALDLWAGCTELRQQCAAAWTALGQARQGLTSLRERLERARQEEEFNRSRWERLEQARLVPGEMEALEQELRQLSHAEEIKETLCEVENLLSPENGEALSRQLREGAKRLDRAARYIPELETLSQRMTSVRLELDDISGELARINERTESSPGRLQQVEERISLLHGLLLKHGESSVEELIAQRERLAGLVLDASQLVEEVEKARSDVQEKEKQYQHLAQELHRRREKGAGGFAGAVLEQLRKLDLEPALFQVQLSESQSGAEGCDRIGFLFSASANQTAVDVSKGASGGELSRIMLALKAVMARFRQMPTLVFDEIDSGVSGSTADKMGSLIGDMGKDMQIFAITHLPQVAAKGHAHYLVSKRGDVSSVRALDAEGRVQELARMLSGATVTPAALANARALLNA